MLRLRYVPHLLLCTCIATTTKTPPWMDDVSQFRSLPGKGVEMIVNHKGEVLTAAHPSAAGKKGLPTFVDDANSPLELAILSPHDGATHFFARATANGGGTDVPLYLTLQWRHGRSEPDAKIDVYIDGTWRLTTTLASRTWLSDMQVGWHNVTALASVRSVEARAETQFRVRAQVNSALGLYLGHETNVAVGVGGDYLVLELERLFDVRYFNLWSWNSGQTFEEIFGTLYMAIDQLVRSFDECYSMHKILERYNNAEAVFDVGVIVTYNVFKDEQILKMLRAESTAAAEWLTVNHHQGHAELALRTAGLSSPLIISVDGGGNDGATNIYEAHHQAGAVLRNQYNYNFGNTYALAGAILREVAGEPFPMPMSEAATNTLRMQNTIHAIPGKMMAFGGLGTINHAWLATAKRYIGRQWWKWIEQLHTDEPPGYGPQLQFFRWRWERDGEWQTEWVDDAAFFINLGNQTVGYPSYDKRWIISPAHQADLAATFQEAFELLLLGIVEIELRAAADVDGIIVTGGCALNVKMNDRLRQHFKIQVSAPSAPADDGLSLGGVLIAHSPHYTDIETATAQHTGFWGCLPWDREILHQIIAGFAMPFTSASALANFMTEEHAVVGVVRGRSEFGPRALGHRSLLAVATQLDIRQKLNIIKKRKWWRPVAPIVAVEAYYDVVQAPTNITSSQDWYMSSAPQLSDSAIDALPGIAHFDGTARVQTISQEDEPWLWELLKRIGELTGWAVVANTSFNRWGKPIVNKYEDALYAFEEEAELGALYLEDYLLSRSSWRTAVDEVQKKPAEMACHVGHHI